MECGMANNVCSYQEKIIEIHCRTLCFDGVAPSENSVDIMYRQLTAYQEAKYPTMKLVSERQWWCPSTFSDDRQFYIFRRLEEMTNSEQLCEDEGCPHSNINHVCIEKQRKPDVIKAALSKHDNV